MKKVTMLEDHDGAKKGDVISVEDNALADAMIAAGKAEPFPKPEPAPEPQAAA